MSNPAVEIAETIQTASIKRHPSPHHDLNPSTAASSKQPVTVSAPSDTEDQEDEDVIPYSVIRPQPRRANLPPLPDLRFEQSYLASISGADTWSRVMWITTRDQVLLPLVQGTLWTLALQGWRFWNQNASYSGRSIGCTESSPESCQTRTDWRLQLDFGYGGTESTIGRFRRPRFARIAPDLHRRLVTCVLL